jgi:linoleate 10R-lipoxygenase
LQWSPARLRWYVIADIVPVAARSLTRQQFTQLLDFYLSELGKKHLSEINRLAKQNTPEAEEKLMHYAMEGYFAPILHHSHSPLPLNQTISNSPLTQNPTGIRLNATFGSYRESTSNTTITDDGHDVSFKPGDKFFVSFVDAARDPAIFPDPEEVKTDRPLESYIHYEGPHTCLGRKASRVALTAMLKVVGRLDNLRRAPGTRGELKKIPRSGGFYTYMKEDWSSYFPFPLSKC